MEPLDNKPGEIYPFSVCVQHAYRLSAKHWANRSEQNATVLALTEGTAWGEKGIEQMSTKVGTEL